MLNEAREQVAHFKWGAWLSKNFEWSRSTANRWMNFAAKVEADPSIVADGDNEHAVQLIVRGNEAAARKEWHG